MIKANKIDMKKNDSIDKNGKKHKNYGLTVLDLYCIKTGKDRATWDRMIADVTKWHDLDKQGLNDAELDNRVGGLLASMKALSIRIQIDRNAVRLPKLITTLPMAEGTYQDIESSISNLLNLVVQARNTGTITKKPVSIPDPYDAEAPKIVKVA